ncbi:MAG: penicillin-binding protein 2, partial [Rhodospirillaceae bacterium]|nr:penicillin-binding protein 2 [Rhodospirillaceae bacterium]
MSWFNKNRTPRRNPTPKVGGPAPMGIKGNSSLEGFAATALKTGRSRLLLIGVLMSLAFLTIGGRLVDVSLLHNGHEPRLADVPSLKLLKKERANIVDRNGVLLATSLTTASLYANPRQILNADEAIRKLRQVLPDLNVKLTRDRLISDKGFIWIRRNLTPRQKYEVNRLGVPGLYFQHEESRVYPHGPLAAHVLGFTDIDHHGLAGIERSMDDILSNRHEPLRVSLDIRVQHILHEELSRAKEKFEAIGGAGIIANVKSGEILALVSLPDFDPNNLKEATDDALFNRATLGVYEMGSTFKIFTTAAALETGTVGLKDGYDATNPIHIARFTIQDYHPKKRWLSVPEILIYSSNIGAAKMALDVGSSAMRKFLGRLGLLRPSAVELPEIGAPMVPTPWREINTMTISYGHGLAVSPLQLTTGISTMVNGGYLRPATLLLDQTDKGKTADNEIRVISERTSQKIRRLMRLVVDKGTGRKAAAPG